MVLISFVWPIYINMNTQKNVFSNGTDTDMSLLAMIRGIWAQNE